MQVELTFPQAVHIQSVYDAQLLTKLTKPTQITVELGPAPSATNEFTLMGKGSVGAGELDLTSISYTCRNVAGPPPAPPHPDDCPLLDQCPMGVKLRLPRPLDAC